MTQLLLSIHLSSVHQGLFLHYGDSYSHVVESIMQACVDDSSFMTTNMPRVLHDSASLLYSTHYTIIILVVQQSLFIM